MYTLTPCLIHFTNNYLMNYDFRIDEEREYGTVEFHKEKSNISRLYTIYATESNSNSTIRKIRMSEDDLNVNGKLVHCGVNYPYNKIYL